MRILLVEDNPSLAKGTAKLIQRLGGHQVEITDEPDVLFQHCGAGAIDLILMDVNLPGAMWEGQDVSGADLSRLLKTQAPTKHIPIVLITAYAMVSERELLLKASLADALCTKPIVDYEALLALIEDLVHGTSKPQ